MAYQFGAVTGRRWRPNYRAMIEAQTPFLTSLYAQREEDKYAKRGQAQAELGLARETTIARERLGLQREQMSAQEAYNAEQLALMQEQMKLGQKQTMGGVGVEGLRLGLQGYQGHQLYDTLEKMSAINAPDVGLVSIPGQPGGVTGAPGTPYEGLAIHGPGAAPTGADPSFTRIPLAGQQQHSSQVSPFADRMIGTMMPQDMGAGGLTPPMAIPGTSYGVPTSPYAFTPPPPTAGLEHMTPGMEAALFTEPGAGAVGLTGAEAGVGGLGVGPTGAGVPVGAGAVPGAGQVSTATGAPGTTGAGFTGAVQGIGLGMAGGTGLYHLAKALGEKPSRLHAYKMAGTTAASAYLTTFPAFGPWSLLAIPAMYAMEPEATEATMAKIHRQDRKIVQQATDEMSRFGKKVAGERIYRPVSKTVEEAKRAGQRVSDAFGHPKQTVKDIERETRRLIEQAKDPNKVIKKAESKIRREVKRIFKGCIIITACTDPNSYEVNVTRRYRDKIMHPTTLRGYYMLAEKVVPLIQESDKLKKFLKKHLVDSLVDTLEWKLNEKTEKPKIKSRLITAAFLSSCRVLGLTKNQFVRCNGEVF